MSKILIDSKTLKLIPDFVVQVEKLVGNVLYGSSMVKDVMELHFNYKEFKKNEVVLARVTRSTETDKLQITSINSTERKYIHYN